MNLAQMRQQIWDRLNFDPELTRYKDSIDQRLNEAYSSLLEDTPYLFAQKVVDFQLYDEVEGSATQTFTATTGNLRQLTPGSDFLVQGWENAGVFHGPGGDIIKIASIDTGVSPNGVVLLEEPLAAAITGADDPADWTIKFPRYPLPMDLIEPYGFTDRNDDGYGRLDFISRRKEEEHWLRDDIQGTAGHVIEGDHESLRAPEYPPTLAVGSGGDNALRASTTYQVAYTFWRGGMESAMSPIAKVKTTASNKTITVSDLEDVQWLVAASSERSGVRIRIYFRDLTNRGKWVMWEELNDDDSPTDIDKELPAYAASRFDITYWEGWGQTQWVRFYATPNEDRALSLRYHFRPPELVANSQMPVGPARTMAQYLVNTVLSELIPDKAIFARQADTAKMSLSNHLQRDDERRIPDNHRHRLMRGRHSRRHDYITAPSRT